MIGLKDGQPSQAALASETFEKILVASRQASERPLDTLRAVKPYTSCCYVDITRKRGTPCTQAVVVVELAIISPVHTETAMASAPEWGGDPPCTQAVVVVFCCVGATD